MKKSRKHVSKKKEDRLMISKGLTRSSSKSMKNLEELPVDLIIQILSKMSVKSLAKLRCVSKNWNSILRSPDVTNLLLKLSSCRPRLLFAVEIGKRLYFSAPQPLNPEKNSSPLTTDYHMCFPLVPCHFSHLFAPVNGLLGTNNISSERGCIDSKVMIFNPTTGQSIPLPLMRGRRDYESTYFGYDPINKQYKVLCLSMRKELVIEHEVLTLGTEKPAWRRIECSLPPYLPYSGICINGVLYYLGHHGNRETLVCFDVRSEKFKFIETDDKVKRPLRFINYKGKLGVLPASIVRFLNGKPRSIELLVLDDIEKNQWSQHVYVLPPLLKDLAANMILHIVGMTSNGELVLSPKVVYDPFYIFFYNVEKNTIARVRIKGMESRRTQCIQTFIDHVENVKLI